MRQRNPKSRQPRTHKSARSSVIDRPCATLAYDSKATTESNVGLAVVARYTRLAAPLEPPSCLEVETAMATSVIKMVAAAANEGHQYSRELACEVLLALTDVDE